MNLKNFLYLCIAKVFQIERSCVPLHFGSGFYFVVVVSPDNLAAYPRVNVVMALTVRFVTLATGKVRRFLCLKMLKNKSLCPTN